MNASMEALAAELTTAIAQQHQSRLTKREQFAMAAMQGMMTMGGIEEWTVEYIVEQSYIVADAMMAVQS